MLLDFSILQEVVHCPCEVIDTGYKLEHCFLIGLSFDYEIFVGLGS